jgi:hypothetical protein
MLYFSLYSTQQLLKEKDDILLKSTTQKVVKVKYSDVIINQTLLLTSQNY